MKYLNESFHCSSRRAHFVLSMKCYDYNYYYYYSLLYRHIKYIIIIVFVLLCVLFYAALTLGKSINALIIG